MTATDQTATEHGSAVSTLTRDFLTWVAAAPRSYAETMEAWRTSCPRFPIWENAVDGGLVGLEHRGAASMRETVVVVTPRGAAVLAGQ